MPTKRARTINLIVMTCASVFSRVGGLATQVITAWYLSPDDFGVYAIALGITTFTLMMRGGGTGIIYQTMRPEEYASVGGGLLRLALFFAVLGALFTLGAALPAQDYYDNQSLAWVLVWMAVLAVLNHLANYPRGKMSSALRFKQLAWIEVAASTVKLVTAFLCARAGWGALTFVFAQVVAVALQLLLTSLLANFRREDFKVEANWLAPTLAMIKYPFALSLMITLMDQIDSFIASLFVPLASLGVYYFSVQLAAQPIRVLTGTLISVLAPYAARSRGNDSLERTNISAAFTSGIIFLPLFVLSIAAVYPSLERLLWGNRWESSIWPVMLTALFLVYPTVQGVLEGPLIGMRRWSLYLVLLSSRTAAKIVGVLLALLAIRLLDIGTPSIAITLVIGVGVVSSIASYIQIRKILLQFEVDREMFTYELYSTPLYALLAVFATQGVVTSILPHLNLPSEHPRVEAAIELVMTMAMYGTVSVILLRFAYIDKLKIILAILPPAIRTLSCKLLVIPESELVLLDKELAKPK